MLANITLGQLLVFVFSTSFIVALISRVPQLSDIWDSLDSKVKDVVLGAVGLLAPAALAAVKAYIPPDYLNFSLENLILLGFNAAAVILIGKINDWFKVEAPRARSQLRGAARAALSK